MFINFRFHAILRGQFGVRWSSRRRLFLQAKPTFRTNLKYLSRKSAVVHFSINNSCLLTTCRLVYCPLPIGNKQQISSQTLKTSPINPDTQTTRLHHWRHMRKSKTHSFAGSPILDSMPISGLELTYWFAKWRNWEQQCNYIVWMSLLATTKSNTLCNI